MRVSERKSLKAEKGAEMRMSKELAERILARPVGNRKNRITDSKRIEIVTDWLEGMRTTELAEKHHVAGSTVNKVLREVKEVLE